MLYVIESIIWCIGMMNKEQKQEQIIKKSLEYFANRYDSLPSGLEKAAELTAHTVFIELICLYQLRHGRSKEELISVINSIADVMVDKIESEVI